MKKYLPLFGIVWLTALAGFLWGAAMVRYEVFPARLLKPPLKQLIGFWRGHPADRRPFLQRLRGELVFDPFYYAIDPAPFPMRHRLAPVDTSAYRGPAIRSLDQARYYSATDRGEYFLIYGSFAFADTHWGAILISTEGRIVRGWSMKPQKYANPNGNIGLALSRNGALATNTHGVLASYGWCGGKNWEADWGGRLAADERTGDRLHGTRGFHHDILYHAGRFHTFLGSEIVSVDEHTGEIEERIHMVELMRWARDQNLGIFDARLSEFYDPRKLNKDNLADMALTNPFHPNKVDVLSEELAGHFDRFKAGDRLVSMRVLNLVFVFRPETGEIPWYRYGLTSRQHDATFQRGYIAVFDNNPYANAGPSPRILRLGVEDHGRSVLFDLRTWGVTMPVRGNFELDDERRRLLFSDDDNGRALVGRLSGKPTFLFENRVESGKNLVLRNITRVSPKQVAEWNAQCDE
ncbi:MAG: arylsulfotransferase family protein [Candidatus Thiosymbion ectosymbiont of Robbea hypermnestra]|nr:arylsulfotransferase family protein [Candidatus Thiosymbion ectosymbiont of Robbea hypermnestra]